MEHSPSWEANQISASQEIPRILWNSKVHYFIYKSQPHVSLSRARSIQSMPPSHFLKGHLKLSFHLRFGLPSDLFPRFTHKTWGKVTTWRPRHVIVMIEQLLYFLQKLCEECRFFLFQKQTVKRSVQCHVFAQSPPDRRPNDKYPVNTSHRSDLCKKFHCSVIW
jgi:hypothetical protein